MNDESKRDAAQWRAAELRQNQQLIVDQRLSELEEKAAAFDWLALQSNVDLSIEDNGDHRIDNWDFDNDSVGRDLFIEESLLEAVNQAMKQED